MGMSAAPVAKLCFLVSFLTTTAAANVNGINDDPRPVHYAAHIYHKTRLEIRDALTQDFIDFNQLITADQHGDGFSNLADNLEILVEPVSDFVNGSIRLSLTRNPPVISDNFDYTVDSTRSASRAVHNSLLYCSYSGYLRIDRVTVSDQSFVYAQLCPQLSLTVHIADQDRYKVIESEENVTRISISLTNGKEAAVYFSRDQKVPMENQPRFGDFVATSDAYVHVSDSTRLPLSSSAAQEKRKVSHFDNILRQKFAMDMMEMASDTRSAASSMIRRRRDVSASALPHIDFETSRFIELCAIVDSGAYEVMRRGGVQTSAEAVQRVADIVSLANTMMTRVNIWIVLVHVEVWTNSRAHRFTYNYSSVINGTRVIDGTATITQLGNYRVDDLLTKRNLSIDHVHLFTNETLPHGYAALALLDEFCFYKSATVSSLTALIMNTDARYSYTLANAEYIAVALAHELGHSLGLDHDDPQNGSHVTARTGKESVQDPQDVVEPNDHSVLLLGNTRCRCDVPGNYCVMWPSIWFNTFPPRWSTCSRQRLTKPPPNYPMDICLRNRPRLARGASQKPVCGDFIVDRDAGEQCDCGPSSVCKDTAASRCCDPDKCRFRNSTFQCSTGACCNTTSCSFASSAAVCRDAANECDLAERCSGRAADCPRNVFKADATTCVDETSNEEGYCLQGWCRTISRQCRAILGPLASKPTALTPYGDDAYCTRYAHCRYRNRDRDLRPQTYEQCVQTPNDTSYGCTKLACEALAEYDSDKVQRISMFIHTISRRAKGCESINKETGDMVYPCDKYCYYFEGDFNPKDVFMRWTDVNFDARMVPDGTKCGDNMMCMNQQCRSIDSLKFSKCVPACDYGQVCDSMGKCQDEQPASHTTVISSKLPLPRITSLYTTRRPSVTPRVGSTTRSVSSSRLTNSTTISTSTSTISADWNVSSTFSPSSNNQDAYVAVIIVAAVLSTLAVGTFLTLLVLYLRRTGRLKNLKDSFRQQFVLPKSILLDRSGRARHRSVSSAGAVAAIDKPIVIDTESNANAVTGRIGPPRPTRPPSISKPILEGTSMDLATTPLMSTLPASDHPPAPRVKKVSDPYFNGSTSAALKTAVDLPRSVVQVSEPQQQRPVAVSRMPSRPSPPPSSDGSSVYTNASSLDNTKSTLMKLLQDTFPDRTSPEHQPSKVPEAPKPKPKPPLLPKIHAAAAVAADRPVPPPVARKPNFNVRLTDDVHKPGAQINSLNAQLTSRFQKL